ncbi:hypothetical protein [Geobacillus sp. 47C-IIb]|nr:hypothetical protein [Geobacillus sp. 47C-IIb]
MAAFIMRDSDELYSKAMAMPPSTNSVWPVWHGCPSHSMVEGLIMAANGELDVAAEDSGRYNKEGEEHKEKEMTA